MIFRLIFKKELEELKAQKAELYDTIKKLNIEKKELADKVQFEQNRFERIKFLLNNRVNKNSKCLIEKTKKGLNVLTAINENEYEIEIFNLDNTEHNLNRALVLWAESREKEYFIQNIQGGNGKGHGEIAMNHLIEIAKRESKEQISGIISSVDFDHKCRLIAFYEKMGFKVNISSDQGGTLIKKL